MSKKIKVIEEEIDSTTTVRIRKSTHDKLRHLSYTKNKRIIDIIDQIVDDAK